MSRSTTLAGEKSFKGFDMGIMEDEYSALESLRADVPQVGCEDTLKVFSSAEFGRVRGFLRDGEPWFVANDVAMALGYAVPKDAVAAHCKYVELLKGGESALFTSSPRGINIIPEADVYALIFRSNLPSADKFRDWVCKDVLPAIRKTGGYNVTPALPNFSNPAEAARAWADEYEKRIEAERCATAALEQNEQLRDIVGLATEWKQVMGIEWLSDYYDTTKESTYQQIGAHLSRLSRAMGQEIRRAPHHKYPNGVGIYHISIIELFRQQTMNDPNCLAKYRKEAML